MSADEKNKYLPQVRKAEFAGLYYPSDRQELIDQIDIKLSEVGEIGADFGVLGVGGLIVPSAGYSYSAKTSLAAYEKIVGRSYKRVIILGQSHFFSFSGVAMSNIPAYESPIGEVKTDQEMVKKLAGNFSFQINEKAFIKEYSLEVQLPFLQRYLKDFQILPLLLGSKLNLTEVAQGLAELLDDNTLVVVSTNFSHFLSDEKARKVDQDTINLLLAKDSKKILTEGQASALGGLAVLNEIAVLKNWQPMFVAYGNSSEAGDDKDSVIGYASLVYFKS